MLTEKRTMDLVYGTLERVPIFIQNFMPNKKAIVAHYNSHLARKLLQKKSLETKFLATISFKIK